MKSDTIRNPVNTFAHVNTRQKIHVLGCCLHQRHGNSECLLKRIKGQNLVVKECAGGSSSAGSDGSHSAFGNGERMLNNGTSTVFSGINFNIHRREHLCVPHRRIVFRSNTVWTSWQDQPRFVIRRQGKHVSEFGFLNVAESPATIELYDTGAGARAESNRYYNGKRGAGKSKNGNCGALR